MNEFKEKKNPKVTKVPWRNNANGQVYYDQQLVDAIRYYHRCERCWTLYNGLGPCWYCRILANEKDNHGTDQSRRPESRR